MQNSSNKELDHSSGQSTSPCVVNCLPWWNSSGSQVPPSSLCKMESPTQHYHNVKRLGLQLQDQDSSSTQSTGQSHHQPTGVRGGSTQGQCILAQSGYYEPSGRQVEDHTKSVLLSGTTDLVTPHSQIDYGHSLACVPYPYADPYFGSLVAASGPHAIIHPHMLGMQPVRVPLPLEFEEDGPVYVNPKQYHGILRRRRSRAKLEAQNKLIKARKPYLHESRHLHAQKRARGSGGRFLNTKQLQQSSKNNTIDSALLQLGTFSNSEALLSEHDGNTNSCSEVTSVSNNDSVFRQPVLQFTGFHSSDLNGSQHRVSAIR